MPCAENFLRKSGISDRYLPDRNRCALLCPTAVYNLIILDRMLPGMDGLSLLKLIRSNEITTPVILATAIDAVPERIAGLDCGADDYIVKPYDMKN